MKELETIIRKNGFDYVQLRKTESAYLYAQRLKDSETCVGYEVFQRRENRPYSIAGIEFPASVAYPSNEAFGNWAWTYRTLENAEARLHAIKKAKTLKEEHHV